MIYWSIMPLETVLEGFEDAHSYPELHTIHLQGGALMEVEVVGPAKGRVRRLISPRAADYLRVEWMPGAMVAL